MNESNLPAAAATICHACKAPLNVLLEPLRQGFLFRLGDRAAVLRGHLAVLACVGDDLDTMDAALLLFHSIAGVAGTYALPELTALARRGESMLTGGLSAGMVAPEALRELDAIVSLMALIHGRDREPSSAAS